MSSHEMQRYSPRCQVFRPPNPWTMATMNVLAELHREPELKLNLKFEIEVLCKNLQVDINVGLISDLDNTPLVCAIMYSVLYHLTNSCRN